MSNAKQDPVQELRQYARDLKRMAAALDKFSAPAAPSVTVAPSLARDVAAGFDPDRQAGDLSLAEVGRIRRAYKMAEVATPRLIIEADAEGMSGAEIARELDVSGSYVSRILRGHKAGK